MIYYFKLLNRESMPIKINEENEKSEFDHIKTI